ncbi:MAG: hypothetical protein ACYDBH_03325 [Acidobacteriaceae bacterium]|jgi:hypothetical protein
MTDLHDLNKNTPATTLAERGTASNEAEKAHQRVEREANKAAERGINRERKEEPGEFSNIGPV